MTNVSWNLRDVADKHHEGSDLEVLLRHAADELDRLERELEEIKAAEDAVFHVLDKAGFVPGIGHECRCMLCKAVARTMDKAGHFDGMADQHKWWRG